MNTEKLAESLALACSWINDVAQVRTPEQAAVGRGSQLRQKDWIGALRGEYRAATREWDFFCPVWHTGQAVKALVMASRVLGRDVLAGAGRGAQFILNNRVTSGKDKGLILAFEDFPDKVNISAILECLDGLFHFAEASGSAECREAALDALAWVAHNAYMRGQGLFRDLYDPEAGAFVPNAYKCEGRPLLDDAVFLKGYQLTDRKEFLAIASETAERLLKDEYPPGNWMRYPPCNMAGGRIHPRQAYWWGYPMLDMHKHSGDARFLECFKRSVGWYRQALRRDGGLFRGTYSDFSTDSFGHATSGVGGAAAMFLAYSRHTGDKDIAPDIERALSFCMQVQFTRPGDPNLKGAILEKVLPPDGSDASPYHLRDLGTIFFIQAASMALAPEGCRALSQKTK